ncbi:ArsR/SmtB family transcription factor [Kitasatospora cineracea]|uniref:ArsR family transcriptional regulator n=1 Tax=Kitasatospora cineracea TaxID=88074 RepID=A0A3N4R5Y3_9ACTN|nr:helix-turn-helix domain-containing protein [Kitasatospora cineracea]RPE26395.1 ArsR family transcriptional regulator [Kitasatospora cineracea]
MSSGNPLGDVEITDPRAMRALAHPVRLAVLERLRLHGPATATELAPHVGATPTVASWHLRHLAEFGLVRDAEPGPDRRKRRWEAVGRGFRFAPGADGAGREAAGALAQVMFRRSADAPARWMAEVGPGLPPQWLRSAGLADTRVVLSPAELAELSAAIEGLLAPYVHRDRADRPADARAVRLLHYTLPEGDGPEDGTE